MAGVRAQRGLQGAPGPSPTYLLLRPCHLCRKNPQEGLVWCCPSVHANEIGSFPVTQTLQMDATDTLGNFCFLK